MAPVRNACIIYNSIPDDLIVLGKTTKYVDSRTIDLDNVSLDGGFLVKTVVLSSDPYLRERMRDPSVESYSPAIVVGALLETYGIVVVLRSDDPNYQVGDHIYSIFNFEEYAVCHVSKAIIPFVKLAKHASLPWSVYVGILGMPGQAAYMGWKEFAEERARKAETVFVSSGAGAVGSVIIQLAKLTNPNIKVIASAGSDEKVNYMKSVGADVAFNYKMQSTQSVLAAEKHIDIYWDNVAGPTLDAALVRMASGGLIVACGAISAYNGNKPGIKNFSQVYARSLKIQGYIITDVLAKYFTQFHSEFPPLVVDGKIKYLEHQYKGIEEAEQALVDVYTGKNFGKAVVVVAEE